MTITDNKGFIICPITLKPVNQHGTTILPEALTELISFSNRIGMELESSALTLDSGFDSKVNHKIIKEQALIPVIHPNKRNTKEPIAIARKFRWFRKNMDKDRYKVERTLMINFRVTFNNS